MAYQPTKMPKLPPPCRKKVIGQLRTVERDKLVHDIPKEGVIAWLVFEHAFYDAAQSSTLPTTPHGLSKPAN